MSKYIITIDAGTTSERAILFNRKGELVNVSQREFEQFYPKPGWVEHSPLEIWETQKFTVNEVLEKQGVHASDIAAIGITNQRETTIVWDRKTGKSIHKAIVWQDRRTAKFCEKLKADGHAEAIQDKTGLLIDAYFSASKIRWILDHVDDAQERAEKGELAFGTVDSWLLWKLTNGQVHATDVSNASRTMLYNIHDLQWDNELLKLFNIPESMLPEVKESSALYGHTDAGHFGAEIPISGIAGDQQSALFGQMCTEPGMVKNTYGTGCFMVMNTGDEVIKSKHKLLSTIAWQVNGKVQYALEGSIFIGGAIVQWLRDNVHFVENSPQIEALARTVKDNGGVYFVPGFVGLGAPHWDQYSTGLMIGLTRGTQKGHIARAALEAMALQSMDVINTMAKDSGIELKELRVDGGASANNLLMQIQSDVTDLDIVRPEIVETTAQGAAFLAGLAVGYWEDMEEIKSIWKVDKKFSPSGKDISQLKHNWARAVERAKAWVEEE
ncbi:MULTISPECIES: glycerol kinase GlpK [Roseivirga]|jgi:glycerol kinase|uniref:Glycerol kinase n=1 Tax=Roseivirga spongicola TaxID=333140 RepID=A0A150XAS4_9BACT|nr:MULTISPECIES: glycerol kinase GlpK [Roseivirga]KYG75825.1 glycerol kinase [Roseivirga spongicola]MBO6662782.1 glycerol kinase GlpK [Roseivirga sp.]MBO6761763.1 glycerol kinase GlpK [Roseivirga sp.]MBO6909840.1 glycerol kinase GlpK [Roseivirga sp.]WPZ10605.1 glycerol kinase GlpK [Roseivirga spongicola]